MPSDLKDKKDLLSSKKMAGFFQENCGPFFDAQEVLSLEILPKNRISKKLIILYKLKLSKDGKKISQNVWGKQAESASLSFLADISKGQMKNHIPKIITSLDNLDFFLMMEVEGAPIRNFEKDFSFWSEKAPNIIDILKKFQLSPSQYLKNHALLEEKSFVELSLEKIKSYSPALAERYNLLAEDYLVALAPLCPKDKFFPCHFDFQPGNVFYDKNKNNFCLLDFDLSQNFVKTADLANFWTHLYVMLRYHFSEEKTDKICEKFLEAYLVEESQKEEIIREFNVMKMRAAIDIAQMTTSAFLKPSAESNEVFSKLEELLSKSKK